MTQSRYEILSKIATGGMATVYVGRARGAAGISRLVAIKQPHPFVYGDPTLLKHVEEEAKTASLIHHANVVSVLDMELVDDKPVLILEYVEGASFSELAKAAAREPSEAWWPIAMRVVLDVAAGLFAAHSQKAESGELLGLVHRDVTPHNALVGLDGVTRLTDFGIAKTNDVSRERTAGNVLKGKLGYMPPEYVDGYGFDAKSDQFSLAVVVWEALARDALFRGNTDGETLRLVMDARVPLLAERDARLAPFDPVVARALARDPADRWASVAELAEALEAVAIASVGVASRFAVTAAIESAFGERLAERRAAAAGLAGSTPSNAVPDDRSSRGRDDIATVSVVHGAPPAAAEAPTVAYPREPLPSRKKSPAPIVAGVVALLLVGAVVLVAAARGRAKPATLEPATSAVIPSASTDEPTAKDPETPPSATASTKPGEAARSRRPWVPRVQPKPRPSATASSPYPVHVDPNPYAR